MKELFPSLFKVIINFVFPKFCCGCSRPYTYLCARCFNKIDFIALPIKVGVEPKYILKIISASYYKGTIRQMIHTFKYEGIKEIAHTLAQLMYYSIVIPQTTYITAVPLHNNRLLERGFNQSAVVAQELAELTKIPYLDLLERVAFTQPQAEIKDQEQRKLNVVNQFALNKCVTSDQLKDATVLIIDDVCTTGSTLNECAKVLKAAGVTEVIGLTVAHGG